MKKRIAVFCDGTWNHPKGDYKTNACLLHESAAEIDGEQLTFYFKGVGTDGDRLGGGLFGSGLDKIVLEAYRKLCEHYDVGDDIFLFGFSRGAYTVRSLAGLVRKCGILKRAHMDRIDEAMALYRRRERDGPDSKDAAEFRRAWASAHHVRDLRGKPADPAFANVMLNIAYIGIWETIGALGVPERVPFSAWFNLRHRFHDCDLSSFVQRARHALAIDETRNSLPPTPWSEASMEEINRFHGERRAEQTWFPGDHGSSGGGGNYIELSSAALLWVAEGAARDGLIFDDRNGHLARARDMAEPVRGRLKGLDHDDFWMMIQGSGPRARGAPQTLVALSEGAIRRLRENPDYVIHGESEEARWRRTTLAAILTHFPEPPRT